MGIGKGLLYTMFTREPNEIREGKRMRKGLLKTMFTRESNGIGEER